MTQIDTIQSAIDTLTTVADNIVSKKDSILKPTDRVMIVTTLFLGIIALIVPYFSERFKRKLFSPTCIFSFSLSPPDCHLTNWTEVSNIIEKPVYYFRFLITNTGKSTLLNCENVVEEIWHFDSSGKPIKVKNFSPVNLKWSGQHGKQFINLNPGRREFCDIGYMPTLAYQKNQSITQNSILQNISGYNKQELRFAFEFAKNFNSQLNCLPPGKYAIKITTYSENYKSVTNNLKISWSGEWKDREEDFFKELVIEKIMRIE